MNRLLLGIAFASTLIGYRTSAESPAASAAPEARLLSGIDIQYIDNTVRAQDDFYQHVNGKWLASTPIPPDRGRYLSIDIVADEVQDQLRGIVEGLQKSVDAADPDQKKIADLYASFMDDRAIEQMGLRPLDAEFARIDALKNKAQIPSQIAHFNRIGIGSPYTPQVHQDAKDSVNYVFDLEQDGLGMPNREYYLQNDAKLTHVRGLYARHVKKMLSLAGDQTAAQDARDIVSLEAELAKVQWTEVENRDPIKTYNKVEFAKLAGVAPGYGWKRYLADSGVGGKTNYLNVSQPSYISGFNGILKRTPLPVWKAYFRWHLLSDFAPYLSKRFADEHFAFYGTALRGIEHDKPRWKLGVDLVNDSIGEALGRIYVAKYFPPESKARMDQLVSNLLVAYRTDIDTLDWMSPQTRRRAQEKLAKYTAKIGYPKKWRDYSTLQIVRRDLIGNVILAKIYEYNRNLDKLGRSIDRAEWDMTPQTVNAHYNLERNEIAFPAAILQPPFFNAKADDAANYGAIGFAIAHEISHGFDDQGSQYDGNGTLLDPPGWFTQADLQKFKAKCQALIAQYSAYSPVPGYPVNGELTLGENIADNAGLTIAYKAYRQSLGGKAAPVIDGLTGDQRFFMAAAQSFRGKVRDNEAIMRIKFDPHSPVKIRGTIPEMNLAAFYEAFGVMDGDKMYLPPDRRVTIW